MFDVAWTYRPDGQAATTSLPSNTAGTVGEVLTHGYAAANGEATTLSSSNGTVYVSDTDYHPNGMPVAMTNGPAGSPEATRTWVYQASTSRLLDALAGIGTATTGIFRTVRIHSDAGLVTSIRDLLGNDHQYACYRRFAFERGPDVVRVLGA